MAVGSSCRSLRPVLGLCARYLRGEHTAKWRDVEAIRGAVRWLALEVDLDHMRRILDHRCPAEFNWEEPAENKEAFIRRGNTPSAKKNMDVVRKTMNNKERKSHVIPFPWWAAQASPNA